MIILEDMPLEKRLKYIEEQRKKKQEELKHVDTPTSSDENRYRCQQTNIIKLDGVISAHSTIKTEYLVGFLSKTQAEVKLEDSIYNFNTQGTEELVAFVSSADQIKNRMIYELDARGSVKSIENQKELSDKWFNFKENLGSNPFAKNLKDDAQKNLFLAGDNEFASDGKLLFKNTYSNLFNQILFGQYLNSDFSEFQAEILHTQSHFFPDIQFDVNCNTTIQADNEENVTYLKSGKPIYVNLDYMIELYDKLYKEQLQYKFTDYSYTIDMNYTVSKTENRIISASVAINESIKNNMESQVLYSLKRVER